MIWFSKKQNKQKFIAYQIRSSEAQREQIKAEISKVKKYERKSVSQIILDALKYYNERRVVK